MWIRTHNANVSGLQLEVQAQLVREGERGERPAHGGQSFDSRSAFTALSTPDPAQLCLLRPSTHGPKKGVCKHLRPRLAHVHSPHLSASSSSGVKRGAWGNL